MTSGADPEPPKKRSPRKEPGPTIAVHGYSIEHGLRIESAEGPEELRSRLAREEEKATHEIWRDRSILLVCLVFFPILAIACLFILLIPGSSAETKTWATSTLTGIATGVVGYSLGKSGKSS